VTAIRIKQLFSVLEKEEEKGPVSAMELLVNRDSFTQTVENLFDFAFLVKDHRAGFSLDEQNLPLCETIQDLSHLGDRYKRLDRLSCERYKRKIRAI